MGCSDGHLCGKNCSTCCLIISVWGVLFLLVVGGLFKSQARAFIPDIEAGHRTAGAMEEAGTACFIAAGMYVATFLISYWQIQVNARKEAGINAAYARLEDQ
eukprot:CAMPEP_0182924556 /NCGR_PEP_ID=MMETSP0105_2-20130417/6623_1 /TAXON_ID=81532 ORGANISM="Acanthoeca-like sp., Strain 10tr" /NCGR_SAMPLE_ID=MMETSP0105_2 /ASSEMBLY_ACC=CAM_ASM_000205 /LENGTH=101 /DNA_ID=CAMNT_0025062347 /DNA_START=23 /DNA_END=328 /DNA_ORIENTATION=+